MNSVGVSQGTEWQVDTKGQSYPFPTAKHGIGIYWQDSSTPDWNAPGYKVSTIRDTAGTILLCEEPNTQNIAGNIWPCICLGPQGAGDVYQMDPSSNARNFGNFQYGIHAKRFNYLFHDQHVETLRMEDTIGTGTLQNPRGMWTINPGD
jgi:hypothetical protein